VLESILGELTRASARRRAPDIILGRDVLINRHSRISAPRGRPISIGDESRVEHGAILATFYGSIEIGSRSMVGPYSVLYGTGGLVIGDNVLIGPHVVIVAANHNFSSADVPIRDQHNTGLGIAIESDVWIGAQASILDGVTVGSGSVVAAGAVVTRDVPPNSLVGGVPAKVIRDRADTPHLSR
jgi:acetyltransferase-like isoleucine patch superfamily enzyme